MLGLVFAATSTETYICVVPSVKMHLFVAVVAVKTYSFVDAIFKAYSIVDAIFKTYSFLAAIFKAYSFVAASGKIYSLYVHFCRCLG